MIQAAMDVAQQFALLLQASEPAIGAALNDEPMRALMEQAKDFAGLISSLMKTLRRVDVA